jgi:hypothetical protein
MKDITTLDSLVGERAWMPGIAAGMLTMSFGPALERLTRTGKRRVTGAVAVHIQCPWRFVVDSRVAVGSADYRAIDDEAEALDYMHARLVALFKDEPTVTAVEDLQASGFRLRFSNDMVLDAVPTQSTADEYSEFWRIFRVGSDAPHFVVVPEGDADV